MTKIVSVLGREILENRLLARSVSTDRGAVKAAISLCGRKVDGIVRIQNLNAGVIGFPLPRQNSFRIGLTHTSALLQGWQFKRQLRFRAQKSSNSVNEGEPNFPNSASRLSPVHSLRSE
jgi:hypothetical protein